MGMKVGRYLTDGVELITVAGVNCRRSAEVIPQDGTKDQRPHPLRTSVSTSAMHERVREEIFPNVLNERSGQKSPDPSIAESQPRSRDQGEREGRGIVAEQPPAPTENTLDGDRVGEEEHDIAEPEFPGGERCVTSSILVRTHLFKLQKEAGRMERFEIPPRVLMRRRKVDSVLSNLSYLPFLPITRCARELLFWIFYSD